MKRYFNHIKETKTPHERRAHAMRVAGALTAVVALLWMTSLGFRYGSTAPGDASQTASAANASNSTINTLVVASSTTGI